MYRVLTVSVFSMAILLRLLLCWENPPKNSFDDHFEPISLIMQTGKIPAKDACFQCYQPPVFYYSSAIAAKALKNLGVADNAIVKSLQFLNCLYCILALLVAYLILKRLRLSEMSRLMAFSILCFLPRHIFMSAIHSNDSLTYLGTALCVYLLLVTIDRELSWQFASLLGITVTLTIFTKYTGFIVLPMVAAPLVTLLFVKSAIPRSKAVKALFLALLVPLIFLGIYMSDNYKDYRRVLPWNDTMLNTGLVHPRDPGDVNYASFTPWQYINEPIVIPGQMHSFWTLIYSGMWVDTEPKFTYFTDGNPDWWDRYITWLRGEAAFPSGPIPISNLTRMITTGLLVCGIVPLVLIVIGFVRCTLTAMSKTTGESVKLQVFPVIFIFNAIGIISMVVKAPVYSSMKASYFLNSLPALGVFIALGIQNVGNKIWVKRSVTLVCCVTILLSSIYVFRIVSADFRY